MNTLAFASPMFNGLVEAVLQDPRETCAIVFTRRALGAPRWVAREVELAPATAYVERTRKRSGLTAAYVLDAANRARTSGCGLCFVHTHPGDQSHPEFSPIDDAGERSLSAYLNARVPGGPHLALVVSPGGAQARLMGTDDAVAVVEVGSSVHYANTPHADISLDQFDRQIRAFGRAGQAALQRLTIGIVGLGGTGSATAQQLSHLGVHRFLLVDPDRVELTNLNRLVGAGPEDVGALKVDVSRRALLRTSPGADVETRAGDVVDAQTAQALLSCDLIFLCTDSHASRAVVGQIAYQFLIPVFDMGISVSIRGGTVAFVTGRVQMLAPGLPCLVCVNALDSEQVRRELLFPEQRAVDPYITGHHEPQPAVISLNSTVSALAVTMALGAVTAAPFGARFQVYDGINGTVRNLARAADPTCFVCSSSGALAQGDASALPIRSER
jgi:molybdopterin-synthase adenylyltransferase